jgi:hypothetical protein
MKPRIAASAAHGSQPPRLPYVLAFMTALFVLGVGIGYYQERAFWFLPWMQPQQPHRPVMADGKDAPPETDLEIMRKRYAARGVEGELLQLAFTAPLIRRQKIHAPISGTEAIFDANESIYVPEAWLADAFDRLRILEASRLLLDEGKTPVLKVRFRLRGRAYDAYAYGQAREACAKSGTASLIFPGSGLNQSSEIYEGVRNNYQFGILEGLSANGGDIFVLIKPNEDILAFHDGAGKLDYSFVINFQLNRNGSYSASYIVQSLAIAKFLRTCYGSLVLAGLSQGGAAALLASFQVKPRAAIIASGYSTLSRKFEWSGFEQIVLPSGTYWNAQEPANIRRRIRALPTTYFFSWGKKDSAPYKMEVDSGSTCKALASLRNVHCMVHDGGHVFPVEAIQRFLQAEMEGS